MEFHNLRPFELGALVWALDWGADPRLRHSLGMGKPFGWGQVAIRIAAASPSDSEEDPEAMLARARQAFVEAMDRWVKKEGIASDWASSPQVRRLKAMADPANATSGRNARLEYMTLDPLKGAAGNEFLEAKRQGLILREYWDSEDQRAFEEWKAGRSKHPPVPIPPLSTVKGLASTRPAIAPPKENRRRPIEPAEGAAPPLYRRGDHVLNIDEREPAEVIADQRNPGDRVRIRYADGSEDAVAAHLLVRR